MAQYSTYTSTDRQHSRAVCCAKIASANHEQEIERSKSVIGDDNTHNLRVVDTRTEIKYTEERGIASRVDNLFTPNLSAVNEKNIAQAVSNKNIDKTLSDKKLEKF
ncbi:hypothetical protein GN244_ATG06172 [Phytophthora infestans]|uniref:Uncharacterized protein n=1 Tax=Phytophthora infestans TaxID=4787 RepID=A0A833T8C8_PHYIN|nr:hypothetical protein GN244_ATG06172 [Phytophthora infestans]